MKHFRLSGSLYLWEHLEGSSECQITFFLKLFQNKTHVVLICYKHILGKFRFFISWLSFITDLNLVPCGSVPVFVTVTARIVFQYISNKMQLYTVYLYLQTALHVSGVTSTHHQERIQLYLQHLVFLTPLLLPAAIAAGNSNCVTNTRCCRYSCFRSWWWVEVTPETCRAVFRYNRLCKAASCWIYIGLYLRCTDPWTSKSCCTFAALKCM